MNQSFLFSLLQILLWLEAFRFYCHVSISDRQVLTFICADWFTTRSFSTVILTHTQRLPLCSCFFMHTLIKSAVTLYRFSFLNSLITEIAEYNRRKKRQTSYVTYRQHHRIEINQKVKQIRDSYEK